MYLMELTFLLILIGILQSIHYKFQHSKRCLTISRPSR